MRSANDTAEFRRNYTAEEFVNGLYALDSGHTGKGVTVGVIDDGAVNVNGELDGRISPLSKDFGFVIKDGVKTARNVVGDEDSDHGTAIANIVGAAAGNGGTTGYAPDVAIAALRVSDRDVDAGKEVYIHSREALDYAGQNGIKVVSRSLIGGGATFADSLTRFAATGGLLVNSAGNESGDSPADAGLVTEANGKAVVFVGSLAVETTGEYALASYSNKAGTMKDRYVVAPGTNVTTSVKSETVLFSGTSSAAPVVTGLAATILSKWPQLTGQQAGEIIINTAKDIGTPGIDEIFGHGLVDFKAALSPVSPTLSNGVKQTSIESAVMVMPSAMGSAEIQTALSNVTVLDAYGRDFSGSVAGMVIRPEEKQGHWLRRRIAQMDQGGRAELAGLGFSGSLGYASYRAGPAPDQVISQLTTGSIAYVSGRNGFRAGWNAADSMQSDVMGLAPFSDGVMAYAPQAANSFGFDHYTAGGKLGVTVSLGRYDGTAARAATLSWNSGRTELRASVVDENGSIMGMPTGSGALRLGRGATTYLLEGRRSVALAGEWNLEGYGSLGITRLKIDRGSVVTGASSILGSRLGVQASGPALGGMLSLGLAQPLRIESGSARLTYANGYDLDSRTLTYGTTEAGLTGARRLQLTAGFSKGGPRSSFRVGMMQDLSDGATRALAGWHLRF